MLQLTWGHAASLAVLALAAAAASYFVGNSAGLRVSRTQAGADLQRSGFKLGNSFFWLILVLVGAAVVYGVFLKPGFEITLPILLIGGVLVLILTLGLLSIIFQAQGLADNRYALALPEGSVRAVIALSLILVFAIVAIYLHGSVHQQSGVHATEVNETELKLLKERIPAALILVEQEITPAVPEVRDGSGAVTTPRKEATYRFVYQSPRNPASEDIAKQLIVLLGTLVTAVASFYFGANSVSTATAAVASALKPDWRRLPSISKVDPPEAALGKQTVVLNVRGRNLGEVTSVRLARSDRPDIKATEVRSTPVLVTCNVTLRGEAEDVGTWEVVVSDGQADVPEFDAFRIKEAAGSSQSSSRGQPTGKASATSSEAGKLEVELTGQRLDQVSDFQLNRDGAVVLDLAKSPGGTPEKIGLTGKPANKLANGDYNIDGIVGGKRVHLTKVTIT